MMNVVGSESESGEISKGSYKYYEIYKSLNIWNFYFCRNICVDPSLFHESPCDCQRRLPLNLQENPLSRFIIKTPNTTHTFCSAQSIERYSVEKKTFPRLFLSQQKLFSKKANTKTKNETRKNYFPKSPDFFVVGMSAKFWRPHWLDGRVNALQLYCSLRIRKCTCLVLECLFRKNADFFHQKNFLFFRQKNFFFFIKKIFFFPSEKFSFEKNERVFFEKEEILPDFVRVGFAVAHFGGGPHRGGFAARHIPTAQALKLRDITVGGEPVHVFDFNSKIPFLEPT